MTEVLSILKELERFKRKSFRQKRFLYPLLFQDDFYGIAYNRFMNELKSRRNKTCKKDCGFNFLTLKRFIRDSRELNFSWVVSNQFFSKFQLFQEIIIIIFNLIFSNRSEPFIKKPNEWNSHQTLHSIFPFMEDNISNSKICLDVTIPYSFHPEILIRIFRRNIQDISFIHFLRFVLHQNEILIISHPRFHLRKDKFQNLLWNFYIYKLEYSLISIWTDIDNFQSTSFWFSLDQMNFVQKIKNISENFNFATVKKTIGKNDSIHYTRYRNNLLIITNGNFNLFAKNFQIFLTFFWEKYFHFWFEPHRLFFKDLSKSPICFLGYIFRNKNKPTILKIQLINNSINANLVNREFCGTTPIIPLIRLLAKEKFCDNLGHPICKLSWTTLADYEIFKRFDQITKNIFCYYSGCSKKKGLYQLQYILRFSCAKTLACKHKSTTRTVWKRYGSNFTTNYVFLKKREANFWRKNSHQKKFWYLNIIRISYLTNLFNKLRNGKNS